MPSQKDRILFQPRALSFRDVLSSRFSQVVVSNDFSLTPIPGEMIHFDVFFDFQMGWFRYCDDKDWQIVSSCRSRQIHRWLEVKQVVRFDLKQPNGEKKATL